MDYVVCAHKAIDQEAAAASLKPAVDPSRTTIVIIQNGVGNEEPFRMQFSDASIVTCVVSRPNGRALAGFVECFTGYPVLEGIAHKSPDVGRGHPGKPWCHQAHQVRGYANWPIPQSAG